MFSFIYSFTSLFRMLKFSMGSAYIKSTFILVKYFFTRFTLLIISRFVCFLFKYFKLYLLKLCTPILILFTPFLFNNDNFSSVISSTFISNVNSFKLSFLNILIISNNLFKFSILRVLGVPPPI